MGQGASPEQPAADAGRPPARLRLLAPVASAGQRGVERPGLQVYHVGRSQVGYPYEGRPSVRFTTSLTLQP